MFGADFQMRDRRDGSIRRFIVDNELPAGLLSKEEIEVHLSTGMLRDPKRRPRPSR